MPMLRTRLDPTIWPAYRLGHGFEYALIAALIAVAAIEAFTLIGTNLSNTFS